MAASSSPRKSSRTPDKKHKARKSASVEEDEVESKQEATDEGEGGTDAEEFEIESIEKADKGYHKKVGGRPANGASHARLVLMPGNFTNTRNLSSRTSGPSSLNGKAMIRVKIAGSTRMICELLLPHGFLPLRSCQITLTDWISLFSAAQKTSSTSSSMIIQKYPRIPESVASRALPQTNPAKATALRPHPLRGPGGGRMRRPPKTTSP